MVLPQNFRKTDSKDWVPRSRTVGDWMEGNQLCPACEKQGRRVGRVTLKALLRREEQSRIGRDQYRFCSEPNCQIVYYAENNSSFFVKTALKVRVGVKECNSPRTVCYCFDHTIEQIDDEVRRTGASTVLDDIKGRMKSACWCETKNPQGSCCLGTVTRAIEEAQKRHGHARGQRRKAAAGMMKECCPPRASFPVADLVGTSPRPSRKVHGNWGLEQTFQIGAVLSAVVASACCWLPLLLLTIGVSGVAGSAVFEQYRPVFMTLTFALLSAAFYFTYRRSPVPVVAALVGSQGSCADGGKSVQADESCCPPQGAGISRMQRLNRLMLWIVTPVALAFAFFPAYADLLLGSRVSSAYSLAVPLDPGALRTLVIEGMTCEGCAAQVRAELSKVQGVREAEVRYGEGKALVAAEAAVSDMSLVEAVERAGYRVRLTPPETGQPFSTPGEMKN